MSEKEIIEAIRILGRYVVDSLPGDFCSYPIRGWGNHKYRGISQAMQKLLPEEEKLIYTNHFG
jgi:hypothetical protein